MVGEILRSYSQRLSVGQKSGSVRQSKRTAKNIEASYS